MFEEQAKEYEERKHHRYEDNDYCGDIADGIIQAYQQGAQFGYNKCKEELNQNGLALQSDMDKTIEQNIALKKELNKANEWHYMEDELPPQKVPLNIITFDKNKKRRVWVGEYDGGNGQWWTGYFNHFIDVPYAWKEITLPEEELLVEEKGVTMGCRNACICSGRCSESCYEAEKYCGEAEDIYDELHGKSKEEEEYYKAMEEQYYKDMEEQEERLRQEQIQNYDFERGDVKYQGVTMFEKEAEDSFKCKKVLYKWETDKHSYIDGFKDGAEFGYNKFRGEVKW